MSYTVEPVTRYAVSGPDGIVKVCNTELHAEIVRLAHEQRAHKKEHGRRLRDAQRSKVYKAEGAVKWESYDAHRTFTTVDDVQQWVDAFFERAYIKRRYVHFYSKHARSQVWVKDGRGSARGRATVGPYGGSVIEMPPHSRKTWYVLHELSHHLAGLSSDHHWLFVSVYLDLVRHIYGADAEKEFKAALRKHNVRWTPKRTRTMSEEQKAAGTARLARHRAERFAAGATSTEFSGTS